ncbi:hypothetical protein I5N04_01895 [Serratia marcescens]|nr:hypothetical protein [Serratia marcescens]
MKERPVIFNSEMVRAILNGRKTQTRRVMKPQPEPCYRGGHWWPSNAFKTMLHIEEQMQNGQGGWKGLAGDACPFGQVGDQLWVRETFRLFDEDKECDCIDFPCNCPPHGTPIYRASNDDIESKWTPAIHMPRKDCRLLLEITAVRVERLNDISEEDARAEGVAPSQHIITPPEALYRVGFLNLWQSIYGAENWSANPWVWVIEFKHVEVRDASK